MREVLSTFEGDVSTKRCKNAGMKGADDEKTGDLDMFGGLDDAVGREYGYEADPKGR